MLGISIAHPRLRGRVMRSGGGVLLAVLASACMISPHDGEEVSSLTATLEIQGYVHEPELLVDVKVLNVETGALDIIGQVEAATEKTETTSDGVDLFHWQGRSNALSIANWGLSDDGKKAEALVQGVLPDGGQLTATNADSVQCYYLNDRSARSFVNECSAPRSPFARVYGPIEANPFSVIMVEQIEGGGRSIRSAFTIPPHDLQPLRFELYRQAGNTITRIRSIANPCANGPVGVRCPILDFTDRPSEPFAEHRYYARLVLPNNKLAFSRPRYLRPVQPPAVPAGFGVANGPGRIGVAWQRAANASHYEVFVNGRFKHETFDTSWEFADVAAGQQYCFRVDAVGPFDRASTAEQCVTGQP